MMLEKRKKDTSLPGYAQVRQYVYALAASNQRSASEPLTTEKELCEIFGMARGTVRRALQMLVEEGMLIRRAHYGTFINPAILAETSPRPGIGVLIGDGEFAYYDDYYIRQLQGAMEGVLDSGYNGRVVQFNGNPESALDRFKRSGAKGVLWMAIGDKERSILSFMRNIDLPVVLAMSGAKVESYESVEMDYYGYGLQLGRALLKNGIRKTLTFDNAPKHKHKVKIAGLAKAYEEHGEPFDESMHLLLSVATAENALAEILAARQDIEGFHAPEVFEHRAAPLLAARPEIYQAFPRSTRTAAAKDQLQIYIPAFETAHAAMRLLLDSIAGRAGPESLESIKINVEISGAPDKRERSKR